MSGLDLTIDDVVYYSKAPNLHTLLQCYECKSEGTSVYISGDLYSLHAYNGSDAYIDYIDD